MSFSSKRGRPCLHRHKSDMGTAELAARHAKGLTMEPLDLCLKRQLISEEGHAAGLHLRWLYSLRFGSPTVRAYDHADVGGKSTKIWDENWRSCRESEYENAIRSLQGIKAHIMVTNIVIFNRFPRFLQPPKHAVVLDRKMEVAHIANTKDLMLFQEGLELLQALFSRKDYRHAKRR